MLTPRKRRNEHYERRFRKVEIRDEADFMKDEKSIRSKKNLTLPSGKVRF
jgi:hypothetical protein